MSDVDLVLEGAQPSPRPSGESGAPRFGARRPPRAGRTVFVGLAALVLVLLPFLVQPFRLQRYTLLIVLSLGVLGLNVVTGQTGLISLGHGAFVGIGAFAMGYFLDSTGMPFLAALVASALLTAAAGAVIGLPALRIRGIYLALVTMGMAIVFPVLAKKFPSITGGVTGRRVESEMFPPAWTGLDADQAQVWRYIFCIIVCAVCFAGVRLIMDSPFGRAMKAVRDNETAAAIFGVNLTSTKLGAFSLSAGLAGTAGALQAIVFPYVSHDQFSVFLSFRLYAAAVLGGLGELVGAIYGVLALIAVPALNDVVGLIENDAVVFGLGLILLNFLSPDGIAGLLRRRGGRNGDRRPRNGVGGPRV